jgi:hypothetical protein
MTKNHLMPNACHLDLVFSINIHLLTLMQSSLDDADECIDMVAK